MIALAARLVPGTLAADFCCVSAPGALPASSKGARRSGSASTLALNRRLFEPGAQFSQYDSSATSDCSQAVYIALNGMTKNTLHGAMLETCGSAGKGERKGSTFPVI